MTLFSIRSRTTVAAYAAALATRFGVLGLGLLIGAISLGTTPARAVTSPRFLPDTDVEVQYTLTVPGQAVHTYDLLFSAETDRVRINDPERGLWFLVDLRNARAALVVPQMHAVVSEPDLANLTAILQSARNAQFTRLGEETIVGLSCTRYRVQSSKVSGTACLTRSGIALALAGQDPHGSAQAVAVSVREATVPPDTLVPPANYSKVTLPRGMIAALLGG